MFGFPYSWCLFKTYLEGAHERFINAHHSTSVVEFTAVIWRRKKCDELTLSEEFVPVFNNLLEGEERS